MISIVLYNGRGCWTAPQTLTELLEPLAPSAESYRPQMRYVLLDEGRYSDEQLVPRRNLVAALYGLENAP